MAGIYTPTVTFSVIPFIEVSTTDATPYNEIQNSQGNVMYLIESLYYVAQTIAQINASITVQHYDSNGTFENTQEVNVADPYQDQPAKNIDLLDKQIIFDGRTNLDIPVFPNEKIGLYFKTIQLEGSDFLKGGKDFFSEDFMETYGFLSDYKDEIIDTFNTIGDEINCK